MLGAPAPLTLARFDVALSHVVAGARSDCRLQATASGSPLMAEGLDRAPPT